MPTLSPPSKVPSVAAFVQLVIIHKHDIIHELILLLLYFKRYLNCRSPKKIKPASHYFINPISWIDFGHLEISASALALALASASAFQY